MKAICLLAIWLWLLTPAVTQAQAAAATEPRTAQFVLVIDDSGSMKGTDPDRLAVFAVRSLLSMLDDRDEVSLVRLNGARDGEAAPPIEPLAKNRSRIEGLLDLNGELARYEGKVTPCRSALAEAARLLAEAYRPNVAQTVLLLTDGECEPAAGETPETASFLSGLRSRDDGLFQLFLLQFRGKGFSPELREIAEKSGGQAIEVGGGDPTAILHPFASALSRSQGYEASLLSPGRSEISAHRGARRVRLLAVAPGQGPPLGVTLHDRQGSAIAPLRPARTGEHRYGAGRIFRFAALDYRPGASPVTAKVTGAANWKIVTLPEYRLSVRLQILAGECGRGGAPGQYAVETGATVCLVAELVNDEGRIVEGGPDVSARIRIRRADQPASAAVELTANPAGDQARFVLQRSRLERGDWELLPTMRLSGGHGAELSVAGRPISLEVSSVSIAAEPARMDFGLLRPGDESAGHPLTLRGNFPAAPGRLEISDRRELPACLTFELSGKREKEPQLLRPDQTYSVTARIAPYCAPESFTRAIETRLRIVFDTAALPAVEVPIELTLENILQVSSGAALRLRAGRSGDADLVVRGNQTRDLVLKVAVIPSGAWPSRRLALDGGGTVVLRPGQGGALRLRGRAHACCAGGTYEARAELRPPDLSAYAPDGLPPEPLGVPVRIEVEPGSFLACWGTRLLGLLLALLLLVLVLYAVSMIRNSRFLDTKRLAGKLVPLSWGSFGATVVRKDGTSEVASLLRRSLTLQQRALAWLKANPLAFGLPGRSYHETVELLLRPKRDVSNSQVLLLTERGLPEKVRREPESFVGRLFATAEGGVSFVAVPDGEGRVGALSLADGAQTSGWEDPGFKLRAVRLSRATRLLKPRDDVEEPEPEGPAGWQVG